MILLFFIDGKSLYTGAFSASSAMFFYLKKTFQILHVTFHLVLEPKNAQIFITLKFQLGVQHLGSSLKQTMLS